MKVKVKKIILIFVFLIYLSQIIHALELTLNIEEDINFELDENLSETKIEKKEKKYESLNQKLKKASSWLILAISATLCTLLVLKR